MTTERALDLALETLESIQAAYPCETVGKRITAIKQARSAPVQEPVQVWQAEGYDALMKEMQMVKARNIRQHAEIERLSALVRAQQITIDKLEQEIAAAVLDHCYGHGGVSDDMIERTTEVIKAKLKEKNNG